MDDTDGDCTSQVTVSGSVNTNVVGNYILTYTYTDQSGNTASVRRTVSVAPLQTPNTPAQVSNVTCSHSTMVVGDTTPNRCWITASDVDGSVSVDAMVGNTPVTLFRQGDEYSVDLRSLNLTPGTYRIRFSVQGVNPDGRPENTIIREASVQVVLAPDNTPPVITLNGGNMTIPYGSTWTEPGYTCMDDTDGDCTSQVTVSGSVNTSVAGTYILTYTYTDQAGNTGTMTREVTVEQMADVPGHASVSIPPGQFLPVGAFPLTLEGSDANGIQSWRLIVTRRDHDDTLIDEYVWAEGGAHPSDPNRIDVNELIRSDHLTAPLGAHIIYTLEITDRLGNVTIATARGTV